MIEIELLFQYFFKGKYNLFFFLSIRVFLFLQLMVDGVVGQVTEDVVSHVGVV